MEVYKVKIYIYRYLLILCTVCAFTNLHAQESLNDKDFILVITSYTADSRRVTTFISDFKKTLVQRADYPYEILMENMNYQGLDKAHLWKEQMKHVLDKYKTPHLKGIILLGQESWASFLSQDSIPNMPFYSYYVSENGVLLNDLPKDPSKWFPESVNTRLVAQKMGGGGFMNQYDVQANINLIRLLYPSVKNIAFLSDNTYGGVSLQARVRKIFAEKYSFLNLILLDSRVYTVEQLKEKITKLPKNTVMLLGTWRVDKSGLYFLQNNIMSLLPEKSTIPIFTLTGLGNGSSVIGGCIPDYSSEKTSYIANKIYDFYHGKNSSINAFSINKNVFVFYKNKLDEYDIHEYQLPENSVVINDSDVLLNKYKTYFEKQTILLVGLVVIIIFLTVLYRRNKRLRKELENSAEELKQAKEKAEESDRLKSAFLANMSHEIRTPLNAIVGFSNLLIQEDVSKEEKEQFGNIITENNNLLLKLINDVLDLSRIESNRIVINNTRFDLSEHIQNICSTMSPRVEKGVKLLYKVPYKHCYIEFDKSRLSQIIINFVVNAIKFTKKGHIKIYYQVQDEGVKISVEDTGIGIPEEKQHLVFERFEKLNDFAQGTGLGLSICKAIMDTVGGDIGVYSTEGKGSTFWIFIPVKVETDK
ncbi:MAG: HAMP domain-containing sensor histidine kinase [Flavobacteriales bacterium]|nr:HAMP domain-containing sensor histidine kinase [Flavobacteriales bacterium]